MFTSLLRMFALFLSIALVAPAFASEQVDIYRAQALVKSQSEDERSAAARATFGELIVRISGQPDALDSPVVRAAIPNAQNYLFGFSYKSSSERLVEGARSFTALALQLDYEPQAIGQLLRDAQLPLWPAQRPKVLVWLVYKDQRGLQLVPELVDFQSINSAAAYRGLPLQHPKHDMEDRFSISAEDLWALDQEKIKEASLRYKADAILVGRYTPSSMGPIPPAMELDTLTDSADSGVSSQAQFSSAVSSAAALEAMDTEPSLTPELAQGPWMGDWLLLHNDEQQTFVDETPEVRGLLANAIHKAANYFANQYAILPSEQGAQQIVLQIGNITSFSAFKNVQTYLEGLALVQHMEVVSVNTQGMLVRLTTEADLRLLMNTLALGRRLSLLQSETIAPSAILPEHLDAAAMADLERALASEQSALEPNLDAALEAGLASSSDADGDVTGGEAGVATDLEADVDPELVAIAAVAAEPAKVVTAGTLADPLIYVWQN